MKQLIDPNMAQRIMLFLAVAGPIVGLIVGLFLGAHEKCAWPKMVGGLLAGALLTMCYGMWRVYGLVTSKLGLDSVWNLCIQITIFAVLGTILGAASFGISNILKRK
jgi:small basic protein